MSFLRKLFAGAESPPDEPSADTDSVRKIVARLEALEPDRARFIAAFAYILGRIAHADDDISAEESRAMETLVRRHGGLPDDQALLVVEIAKSQNRLFGGTENFLVTREFAQVADREQKLALLDSLFAVSAADDSVSLIEEEQARQVATELGLTHDDYVAVRSRYADQREVLKRFEERSES